MRVLLLSQWFDPEPTFKGLAFARALGAAGHEVEVLTGFPNYPGGRIYDGYRMKAFTRESLDGVAVLRVALYPSHDASGLRRALNYASFAVSASVLGTFLARNPDVIYAYHPPLTTGLAATVLSITKRAPFVYDVQDLWPDTLAATGMVRSSRILALIGAVSRWVYRRAAYVTVLSPGFENELKGRGVPAEKIEVIYNWCDEGQLRLEHSPAMSERLRAGERFNVVFAGTIGKAQGLETVLEAARLLEAEGPDVQFVFVGDGVETESLVSAAGRMGLTNVRFLPRMPVSEVGQVLAVADVLLVHLRDDPLFQITIPSKTQAYMSLGKPVLMAVRGDAADLIATSGGGVVCAPGDPAAMAEAVLALAALPAADLKAMGERGREYYRSELSFQNGTARFIDVFERVRRGRATR